MKEMFKRFGKMLGDPATGIALKIPDNFRTKHKFNNTGSVVDPIQNLEIS